MLSIRLNRCHSRQDLCEWARTELKNAFAGERARLFFYAENAGWAELSANPVAQALRQTESPVHQAQLVDNQTWRRYCPRADHGQVLVGPVLSGCEQVGVAAVTRHREAPPFEHSDLQRMTRFCLYLSARLSQLESAPRRPLNGLTEREQDVAAGVRSGLKNAEIARRLSLSEHTVKQNLKAIFRKLGLRSRTELALLGSS